MDSLKCHFGISNSRGGDRNYDEFDIEGIEGGE